MKSLEYYNKDVFAAPEDLSRGATSPSMFIKSLCSSVDRRVGKLKSKRSETSKIWHSSPIPNKRQWERGRQICVQDGEINRFLVPGGMKSERVKEPRRVGSWGGWWDY